MKFNNFAALFAYQMVMVAIMRQFKHRQIIVKVVPLNDTDLLKLRQNAVHGRKPDILALLNQRLVHVLGTHVMFRCAL